MDVAVEDVGVPRRSAVPPNAIERRNAARGTNCCKCTTDDDELVVDSVGGAAVEAFGISSGEREERFVLDQHPDVSEL